jgi:transcriptional regulator
MYTPSHYRETDREKLLEFMREYSFATLVSFDGEKPIATHLPFAVSTDGDRIVLTTHMARANKQWKSLGEQDVLVIFSGPNAYISPTNYESKVTVPTWNYIAVHAYGKPRVLDAGEFDSVLRRMIDTYEPEYLAQYEALPDDYRIPNMKAIACIEIEVTRLEAQFKLSQDKKPADKARVEHSLAASDDDTKRAIAKEMHKLREE